MHASLKFLKFANAPQNSDFNYFVEDKNFFPHGLFFFLWPTRSAGKNFSTKILHNKFFTFAGDKTATSIILLETKIFFTRFFLWPSRSARKIFSTKILNKKVFAYAGDKTADFNYFVGDKN